MTAPKDPAALAEWARGQVVRTQQQVRTVEVVGIMVTIFVWFSLVFWLKDLHIEGVKRAKAWDVIMDRRCASAYGEGAVYGEWVTGPIRYRPGKYPLRGADVREGCVLGGEFVGPAHGPPPQPDEIAEVSGG